MTNQKKITKVEFAPGCFDSFEGTQAELDELVAEIQRMAESGELTEKSRQLTEEDFDELPEEVQEFLAQSMDDTGTKRPLN